MIPCKAIVEESEKLSNDILIWNNSKEKVLNLISLPYNSSIVFINIVLEYTALNKRVLYISNEKNEKIDLIENIKRYSSFRDYSYIRKNNRTGTLNPRLVICSHDNALTLNSEFDLVIYDDLSAYTNYSKYEILDLLTLYCKGNTKIICRTIEPVFQNAADIEFPIKNCKLPVAEPRLITTRIDINKEIPFAVYEYLSWSSASERKVIIYVPDDERGENVYKYLNDIKEKLHNNIMFCAEGEDRKKVINFMKNKKGILIMKCSQEFNLDMVDTDIMVYFADDKCFTYKRLIYICGKVGRSPGLGMGEVIYLSKDTSNDIETSKDIIRRFNKRAWEMGLLQA